ncbi:MAG: MBL fold metallo-hydrolase [Chloroflexota bacterium]|jgi:competence protein ComEC
MTARQDGNLHVYMLSVGQADTSVIVSPKGTVIVIDATRPSKLLRLLSDLGSNGTIEHLVITHPHDDHFSGGNSLANNSTIEHATVAPFWHEFGMGPTTYRRLIGRLEAQGTNVAFLSGYSRWYLDNALMDDPAGGGDPVIDPNAPYLELLGPTNGLVRLLEEANIFNTNHLSIMTRLAWRNFRMISAGDAQMENWSFFDQERLMEDRCHVLRAAHHGSMNGTQWERIDRLNPIELIVSSDPAGRHHLPDLIGAANLTKFDSMDNRMAVMTRDSGSIHLTVTAGGKRTFECFGDDPAANVDLGAAALLDHQTNPTDWPGLLNDRVANP